MKIPALKSTASVRSILGRLLTSANGYVFFLCIVGAARTFLGATSAPLFSDVDEVPHFDLVAKFARGYWPRMTRERFDDETKLITTYYGSKEFGTPPEKVQGAYPLPVWMVDPAVRREPVERFKDRFNSLVNVEAHSPPIYYLLAAAWYDFGRLLGLRGPFAAYWVRIFDVPICVILIIVS